MALSRRSLVGLCTSVGGTVLLAAIAMAPALAGTGPTPLAGGGCSATAHLETQWGTGASGGQIIGVTVTNTSATTTMKWATAWTLGAGQRVGWAWNAVVTTSSRGATAVNTSYNGVLAPGTVDVSTTTDIACNHDPMPCPSPSVPWLIHVVVSA
jgi:hypothetical protein